MPARKGQPKVAGRQKGTPNKTTAAVKAALVEAFDELGGVASLVKWGKANPTEFYKLWAKMLPTEIKNADGQPLQLRIVESIVDGDRDEDGSTPPGPTPVPA